MSSWQQIDQDVPRLTAAVRRRFDMGTNKTIATLRRDGAPRISAIEIEFRDDQVTFGMMGGSMKLRDVRRDPRIAIHSPTIEATGTDADEWPGDAKLAGTAVEIPAPPDNTYPGAGFFRVEITEIVLTYIGTPPDHLVIESWHPGTGLRRRKQA